MDVPIDPAGNVAPLPPRQTDHRTKRDDDRGVVGFGDHMPAFLARAGAVTRG